MKHLMGTTAIVALLAAGTAFAQTDDTTMPMDQPMQQDDALGTDGMQTADPAASEMWIRDEGQVLSSDLIGTEVFDSAGESLGQIENLVISLAGDSGASIGLDSGTDTMEPGSAAMDSGAGGETILTPDDSAPSDQAELDTEQPTDGVEGDFAETEPLPESGAQSDQSLAESTEPLPEDSQPSDQFAADQSETMIEPETDPGGEVAIEETQPDTGVESDLAESQPLSGDTVGAGPEQYQNVEVTAAIIGVGGFLGIGRKDVAVGIENLEFYSADDGDRRIVLNTTREDLEAAPEFSEDEVQGQGGAAMDPGAPMDGGAVDGGALDGGSAN